MRTSAAWLVRGTWLSGVLLFAAVASSAAQSTSTGIRVIPPLDGATLEPGAQATVVVEPEGPTPLREVVIVTRGAAQRILAAPFQFTFRAPQALGRYELGVTAQDEKGHLFDAELTYSVETATPVTSIRVKSTVFGQPASVDFFGANDREHLDVEGTFADGMTREITKSREIRFTSNNPQVVTVTPEGLVEAVEPGKTTITVTYKDKTTTVPVTVKFRKLTVPLDIEPRDGRNRINLDSRGHVRVAILSTETFAATTVSPGTVRFGPGQAPPLAEDDDEDGEDDRDGRRKHKGTTRKAKHHLEDTNDDGRPDLLLQFSIPATGLACADSQATLTGVTFSGDRISGSDTIRVVGKACR